MVHITRIMPLLQYKGRRTLREIWTPELHKKLIAVAKIILQARYYSAGGVRSTCLTEACDEAINDLFIADFERYVDKYDSERGRTFEDFCVIEFRYCLSRSLYQNVSRKNSGANKVNSAAQLDSSVDVAMSDAGLSPLDTMCAQCESDVMATAIAKLKELDSKASWVVWNYMQGKSFDEIAQSISVSRNTCRAIYAGGIDTLRRLMGVSADAD